MQGHCHRGRLLMEPPLLLLTQPHRPASPGSSRPGCACWCSSVRRTTWAQLLFVVHSPAATKDHNPSLICVLMSPSAGLWTPPPVLVSCRCTHRSITVVQGKDPRRPGIVMNTRSPYTAAALISTSRRHHVFAVCLGCRRHLRQPSRTSSTASSQAEASALMRPPCWHSSESGTRTLAE